MNELDVYAAGSQLDAIKTIGPNGVESWSARDLMAPLGYGADWRNFVDTVNRAEAACKNSGYEPADHFGAATKMVRIGSGATRSIADYRLTRYAAYLVAMNGDPRKPEIAAAQTYFAVKTREAETAQPSVASIGRRELALMVIDAEDRAAAAEQQLAAVTPKAQAWDAFVAADGDHSVEEVAKMLARAGVITGRGRLFGELHAWGWIYRYGDHGPFRPMQRYVEKGWLRLKAQSYEHPKTGEPTVAAPQIRITADGARAIRTKLTAPEQLKLPVGTS